ncbi:MAG: hypothetical protein ACXWDJ_11285 [Aeromicrobium sp.]
MRYLPLIDLTPALVSCSSSGDDESSFSADRADLHTSFQDLQDVNVADDGIEDQDAAVDVVITDLGTLRVSATEFEPQVDAVEYALQERRTAVASATTPVEKATRPPRHCRSG